MSSDPTQKWRAKRVADPVEFISVDALTGLPEREGQPPKPPRAPSLPRRRKQKYAKRPWRRGLGDPRPLRSPPVEAMGELPFRPPAPQRSLRSPKIAAPRREVPPTERKRPGHRPQLAPDSRRSIKRCVICTLDERTKMWRAATRLGMRVSKYVAMTIKSAAMTHHRIHAYMASVASKQPEATPKPLRQEPHGPNNPRRKFWVHFTMTMADYADVQRAAAFAGLEVMTWIRAVMIKDMERLARKPDAPDSEIAPELDVGVDDL